jgi:HlyD family secretion protein
VPRLTRRRKIVIGISAVLVLAPIATTIVNKQRAKILAVQVGAVTRQNLTSVVTASGEIRPRHYVNITSQTFGKITAIEVAEGDTVKAGQVLLRMEAVQPAAGVAAQSAMVKSAQAAVTAAEANERTADAERTRANADFDRAKLDWERAEQLFGRGLISQSEHDISKSSFESARAAVAVAEARVHQAAAELDRNHSQLAETRAGLSRSEDELQKTIYMSPIDGIVTSLVVHVGEQMVPGIQNSPGSYLMTVADMSEVTAEVRVDESDVLDVRNGQRAEVTVDAYPDSVFKGRVAEIGTTALLRSSGQTSTQLTTGSQEAKDFKVVIALDQPPPGMRPGLSATGRITTADHDKALSIPIQALTMRRQADIDAAEKSAGKGKGAAKDKDKDKGHAAGDAQAAPTQAAAPSATTPAAGGADAAGKKEVQGVFVVQDGRAHFYPVKTGITGVTDIEILSGVKEGDQIVTGSYKVLRDLKHLAKVRKAKGEEKKPTR